MDDRRFDNVVRSLVSHRSRRGLVGGLLGGGLAMVAAHLRLPGVEAGQGYSAQGEPCYDDAQCLAADTPLVCAWNGYGSAGAACCTGIDGRCGDDAGCCGPNTCYLGTCQNLNIPAVGEACWQLPNDPDPCDDRSVCIHDWQSGDIWGTCQPFATGTGGATGDWCGNKYCASWERCCNASCGACVTGGTACSDDVCVACPGCDSGLCFSNGYCAP
jgi:hypothetical protein